MQGRLHGAYRATAIAECFRDRGLDILPALDSWTRLATAQCEIGLPFCEIQASRDYPAAVFGRIATLCERAGNGQDDKSAVKMLIGSIHQRTERRAGEHLLQHLDRRMIDRRLPPCR